MIGREAALGLIKSFPLTAVLFPLLRLFFYASTLEMEAQEIKPNPDLIFRFVLFFEAFSQRSRFQLMGYMVLGNLQAAWYPHHISFCCMKLI